MLDRETDATDYEGERLDRDYDARQALHFRRGLLGYHTADFRRTTTCPKDYTTWNVRCRVLGGGGQFFFPLEPSLYIRRPVHRVFLNLRKVYSIKPTKRRRTYYVHRAQHIAGFGADLASFIRGSGAHGHRDCR
jgi:hypothetical protein